MQEPASIWRRLLRSLPGDAGTSPQRTMLLRRTLALFALALVAATWPLWTPQQRFPQVPFWSALATLPLAWQWLGLALMLSGLVAALLAPPRARRWCRGSLWLFALSTGVLTLADQHRLQPWAYQFLLLAVLLATTEPRTAIGWLRLFIAVFYFHSAVTKLDYSFTHTLGQQFLSTLLQFVGASSENWNDAVRVGAALAFPLAELAVALALLLPATRSLGLAGAIALHLLLLVILGPWGLNHKPGVLLWNTYFIVQNVWLFGPDRWVQAVARPQPAIELPSGGSGRAPRWVEVLLVAAMVLPLLEPTSWFDMWPSWGLYASSAQRVQLLVHRAQRGRLPASLDAWIEESDDPADPWLTLRLDRWSLDVLGAPLYPQNRFQLGVATAVVAQYDLGPSARAARLQIANRWTGRRDHDVLLGFSQMSAAQSDYWLGSRPHASVLMP